MKIELHHIEAAVRKQFLWTADQKTRWATDPAANLGSKGLGATVFIGLAVYGFGYTLGDLENYMDLEPLDIQAKLKAFGLRMNEMLRRKLTGVDLKKQDMTQLMSLKKDLALSHLRWHQRREYISLAELNY